MADVITAKGRNGQVHFDGKTVRITREGFMGRVKHGRNDKTIPLRTISAIQFKAATKLMLGYIQFSVPGEVASTRKGKNAALKDENGVIFSAKAQPEFDSLQNAVNSALADL